jgi:CBS-domain-containing membrane protein
MAQDFSGSRLTQVLLAGFGSFVAIYGLTACDSLLRTNGVAGVALIGSFGATAVLVYGAPQAEFSRFRNVVGGHVLSAVFGVVAATTLGPDNAVAAGVAVALAVVAMALTHTVHPPGGATALIAVTGGERILHMGYSYVFIPVLVGALCMYTLGFVSRRIGRLRFVTPAARQTGPAQELASAALTPDVIVD